MSAEIKSDFRLDLKKISTYQKKSLLTTTKKWLSSHLTSAYLMHARTTRKIPWPAKHYWLDLSFPKPNRSTCCLLWTEFLFSLPLKMIWKPRNFLQDSVKQALCLDLVVMMPSYFQLRFLLCSSVKKWKTWQMQSSYFSLLVSLQWCSWDALRGHSESDIMLSVRQGLLQQPQWGCYHN